MTKYFNEQAILEAKPLVRSAPSGFKYGFIPDVFHEEAYLELMRTFPEVKQFQFVKKMSGGGQKQFFVGPTYDANKSFGCVCRLRRIHPSWKAVLQESADTGLMGLLNELTGVSFNTMCTFGFAYGNQGCMQGAHVDGAVRSDDKSAVRSTLACLLYLNEKPDNISGTCVYATDRRTVLLQAPSMRNGMFFFEQHPDAWHGFPELPSGVERRIVSLAYAQPASSIGLKRSPIHKLGCRNFWKTIVS